MEPQYQQAVNRVDEEDDDEAEEAVRRRRRAVANLPREEEQDVDGQPSRKRTWHRLPPGVTTIVVRNIPWDCTQHELSHMWPHEDTYDYLHLPQALDQARTTTYMFMNFLTHEGAERFNEQWHGRFLPHRGGARSLSIAVASTQGVRGNLARFTSAELDDMALHGVLPLAFRKNVPIDCRWLYLSFGLKGEEDRRPRLAAVPTEARAAGSDAGDDGPPAADREVAGSQSSSWTGTTVGTAEQAPEAGTPPDEGEVPVPRRLRCTDPVLPGQPGWAHEPE